MKFIDNQGITDPTINLAIEEYAVKYLPADEDYLLFYINEPSIIIGKNQNTIAEINSQYVEEHGIHVVRRLSGGGAVYHDLGNLNFSFITNNDGQSFHNYKKFTEPVVQALRNLGVQAELTGRNDIQVGERKISGNAQFAMKGRMYTHGTLMFDSKLEDVVSALKVNAAKIESKGIKSIRSRVANIIEFMSEAMTIEQFRKHLLESIFRGSDIPEYRLTEEDWRKIKEISEQRYRSWDWNFGKSPLSNLVRSQRIEGAGTIEPHLQINGGIIEDIHIYGDFFGMEDVREVEAALKGIPYRKESIEAALKNIDIPKYFGKVDRSDLVAVLI
ncbi:lipoate--protein ligase [Marinicrinis lubricantis]|uniref:lipoate--protein ligase n=1 Tax=Marinicrinis lubricantis TaxID=2086470 RepID=A0ABW1IQE5_9BACL